MATSKNLRCTGHCCRRFALDHSYEHLQAQYKKWLEDGMPANQADIATIAQMVIPLENSRDKTEHVYRCKNLSIQGDCTIYESRPQMCRDFPDEKGCHFWKCTSDVSAYYNQPFTMKILTRWRWLRQLVKNEP